MPCTPVGSGLISVQSASGHMDAVRGSAGGADGSERTQRRGIVKKRHGGISGFVSGKDL